MRILQWVHLTTWAFVVMLTASSCQNLDTPIANGRFPLKERWRFEVGDEIAAEPGVGNGKVIVRTKSQVYALDALTGTLVWETPVPLDSMFIPTPPLVENDLVVIEYRADTVALNTTTGQVTWESETTGCAGIRLAPIAASKTMVYVVRDDCNVEAHDRATGAVVWEADLPGARSGADLFLDQNKIYLVITNDILQVRDAATGKLIEEIKGQIGRPATYRSGILYGFKGEGELVAFDTGAQRMLWSSQGWRKGEYSPVLNGQRVLVPTRSDVPVAFDARTGQRLWTAKTDKDTYQTPVVLSDIVYIRGIFSGIIYALSIQDGSEIGQLLTGNRPVISDFSYTWQPAIAEGLLIVPMGKRVYAYGD